MYVFLNSVRSLAELLIEVIGIWHTKGHFVFFSQGRKKSTFRSFTLSSEESNEVLEHPNSAV